jgi:intracellular septation protein A
MRDFLKALRLLLFDFASTIVFVVLYLLTHNTILSVGLGIGLSLVQTGTQFIRRSPIAAMEWLSLFLVIATGTATLLTDDPRIALFKPSVFYVIAGVVMLKPGWMNHYLVPIGKVVVPDVAVVLGFVWAALMFVSATVNAFVALSYGMATWGLIMPIFGIISKFAVFSFGFAALRFMTVRRVRAMPAAERDALLTATGYR